MRTLFSKSSGETTALTIRTASQIAFAFAVICLFATLTPAQDNYEIQVYGSETIPRGETMVELHNNFTAKGSKQTDDGTLPTNHAWHETIEITHGFNDWFETGFYIFTSARDGSGLDFVGTHIRPRFRVPPKWHWPVGVSLSQEVGYVRRKFSEDTWSWEIRPIIDKQIKRWYFSFNPALERSLKGPGTKRGFELSPNFKFAYSITKQVDGGIEYYGALGPLSGFDPKRDQQHQIFPAIDLNVSPKWEFNFGVGIGLTRSTDHLILKMIIGRRFTFGQKSAKPKDSSPE
ncbi:MAG TPA: transporter [Pyrinomonadaceae bacterium]